MAGRRQRERDDYGGHQVDEYGRASGGGERDDYGQAWDSGYGMVRPGADAGRWPGRRALTDGMERSVIPRMEQAFGLSFGDVRVRTDEAAADMADRMGARAWAEADEIGFARGEFRPDTREGLHTIAHEFAHIAQGRGGTGGELGPVSLGAARGRARDGASADAVEADADRAADAVVSGERAVVAPVELSFARRKAVAAASAGPEPPPRGSVFISPVGNGWMMVWNGDDVRRWTGDARVRVLGELARTVFPGASEAVIAAFVASPRGVVEWGSGAFDARAYRERVLLVHILPELHAGMLDWMEDNHPELAAAAISPGFRPVGGAGGRKGGRGKALEEGGAGKAGERPGVASSGRVGPETRAGSSPGGVEEGGSSAVDAAETFPPAARLLGPEPGSIHVAGAKVRFEVQHDFDDPRYPKRWLLHVPGHASYHWKISVAGRPEPLEVDTPDRVVHLPLVFGPGRYVFAVTPRSRHFGTYPELILTHAVEVHSEKARDREVFDASLPGSPFERSGDTLGAREGAAAPTPEREIAALRHELDEVAGAASELSPEVLKLYRAQTQRQIRAQQGIAKQHQGQQPYLVHGTFLSRENSTSVQLKLSMYAQFRRLDGAPSDKTACVVTVHDSTLSPGEPKQAVGYAISHARDPEVAQAAAEVAALDELKAQWHSHNDYPNGTLHLAVQLQHGEHAVRELSFDTSSTLRTVRSVLGTVASAAGLALLVLPGGGVLSAGLLIVSGAAGTASTLLSLQHRAETEGGLRADGQLALDLLSLATNFASLGGFTQTIQRGSGLVRGMYYGSMAGLAGAQGYLIAAETKAAVADLEAQFAIQIARAPQAERESLRKQRDHAIASAIGDAIISGGFLLVSVAGIIKDSLARRGSDVRPYVEEAALSASPERIAELLRADAEGKAPLTAGERKLLESVAGTPGTRTTDGADAWPSTKPGATTEVPTGRPPRAGTFSVAEIVDRGRMNIRVGRPMASLDEGMGALRRLGAGDRAGGAAVGLEPLPAEFDPRSTEWGLGKTADGWYVLVKGEPGGVLWERLPDLTGVAHAHPYLANKVLPESGGRGVSLRQLAKNLIVDDYSRASVFPSGSDIRYQVLSGLNEHVVQTPYEHLGDDRVGNPSGAGDRAALSFSIKNGSRWAKDWAGQPQNPVFHAHIEARAGGTVLWEGDVWAVFLDNKRSFLEFKPPSL